jgi:small subunit ribosomal protein S16
VVGLAPRTAGPSGNWRLSIFGLRRTIVAPKGRFVLLTIRLARTGKKKHPSYRVVVIESTRRRDGRFVEIVGHYEPRKQPAGITLNRERIQHWLSCGAQPSETVRSFLRKEKIA